MKRIALVMFWTIVGVSACAQEDAPQQRADDRAQDAALNQPPAGFVALFNGEDLTGWKGLVGNPATRAEMAEEELAQAQAKADEVMRAHWSVEDGVLIFDGDEAGRHLCTEREFRNFELFVDWKIEPGGDSGIYLRGSPQVQIWDNPIGSGGLYNNQVHPSAPLVVADNTPGQWNTFRIIMVNRRVTVYLNDLLVVDQVMLENDWDRGVAIFPSGQIELQSHGTPLYFRNIFLRELPEKPLESARSVMRPGDRLAVVGDSITEQKLYSSALETYFMVCQPELDVHVMQFGWSGETAPEFLDRMGNDLMPFQPDVVTLCYGMNDGGYQEYTGQIGAAYSEALQRIITTFTRRRVRVIVGAPGAVDPATFTRLDPSVYNDTLAKLRDVARELASRHNQQFANVHDWMRIAMIRAKHAYGSAYHLAGADGVHPDWNGHIVMAYAFLKAMKVQGHVGTIMIDLENQASATDGHRIVHEDGMTVMLESTRYPFCFTGEDQSPSSTKSIEPFLPFNQELNRLYLIVRNLDAPYADVTWGASTRRFTGEALARGVNLAGAFLDNPFVADFTKVQRLIEEKQAFETYMIQEVISKHRAIEPADEAALEAAAREREELFARQQEWHERIKEAITPVQHTITITPVNEE